VDTLTAAAARAVSTSFGRHCSDWWHNGFFNGFFDFSQQVELVFAERAAACSSSKPQSCRGTLRLRYQCGSNQVIVLRVFTLSRQSRDQAALGGARKAAGCDPLPKQG
jgi:hypothetical protein